MGLFPAYAGVIPPGSLQFDSEASFPRVCGGDPKSNVSLGGSLNFSPRMRG